MRDLIEKTVFYLLILFLPTQLGKHFWPDFAFISGIRIDYLSPTLYLTDILVALLFGLWLISSVSHKTFTFHLNKKSALYLLFLVFLFITIISGNVLSGLYHLLKFLEFSFIAYYVATHVGKSISLGKISQVLAVGIIGEFLLALAQYMTHGSIGGLFYYVGERTFTAATPGIANASVNGELILRPYGTFPHPNVLAGYLVVSMLFIFFFLFKNKTKGFAAFALFLGSSALLLTLSRVAIALWILFIAGVFIWQIKRAMKVNKKQAAVTIAACIILLSFGWFVFSQTITPRFSETTLAEEAVVQRSILTGAAIEMIKDHPFLGVGLGNFLPALGAIRSPLSLGLYLQPVHNLFLLVASEIGLIGLGVFLIFLGKIFQRLFYRMKQKKLFRESLFLFLVLLTILILGQFDHYFLTLQQGQLLLALVLGACFTLGKRSLNLGEGKNTRTW